MFCYQHKFVADGNIFYPSPGLLDSCLCSTCSKSRLQHHDLKKGVRAFLAKPEFTILELECTKCPFPAPWIRKSKKTGMKHTCSILMFKPPIDSRYGLRSYSMSQALQRKSIETLFRKRFFCVSRLMSAPPPPPHPHDFNTAHDTANNITRIMHSSFPTSRFNDMM